MLDEFRIKVASLISPELREQRDQAVRAANVDPLTGIANRRAFDLARPSFEADPSTCVILFDANNFGALNKLAGHDIGDKVLIKLASTLRQVAARHELASRVFRLGGDEFAILAPCSIAEKIRDTVELAFSEYQIKDLCVSVSGTIGKNIADADRTLQARKHERKGIKQ